MPPKSSGYKKKDSVQRVVKKSTRRVKGKDGIDRVGGKKVPYLQQVAEAKTPAQARRVTRRSSIKWAHESPAQARVTDRKEAKRLVGNIKRPAPKPKEKKEDKSVLGLIVNARRNARDIVTGAPASAVALLKAEGEELGNLTKRVVASAGGPKAKEAPGIEPIKKGIQRDDAVYALGEAAVKKVKGDDKGAKKALDRAGDNAYERPVDVAAYAAGGAGAVGRGATAAKHKGKGGTAAARARPPLKVDGDGKSSKAQVQRQREAAKAEVRVRRADSTRDKGTAKQRDDAKAKRERGVAADRATVARIKREPAVRRERTYSANAATRTVQKARENRKAKKGLDPFQATARKARKIRRKRFDEHSRNVHAGGLAREQVAAEANRSQRKELRKDDLNDVAADLLANFRVGPGKEVEHLQALRDTAAKREGGDKNVKVYDKLLKEPGRLKDPVVLKVAQARREALHGSEGRAKREGYFEGRDGKGTNPDLVAKLQPLLARGDVVERDGPGAPSEREGGSQPTPPQPKAPEPRPEAPEADSTRPDVEAILRGTSVRKMRERANALDTEISLREKAAREAERFLHPKARGKDDVSVGGRGKRKILSKKGTFRDLEELKALRAERAGLRTKLDVIDVQEKLAAVPKAGTAPRGVAKVVPGSKSPKPGRPLVTKDGTPIDTAADRRRLEANVEQERRSALGAPGGRVVRPATGVGTPGGSPVLRLDEQEGGRDKRGDEQGSAEAIEKPVVRTGRAQVSSGGPRVPPTRSGAERVKGRYLWAHGPRKGQVVIEADVEGEQGAFIRGLDGKSEPNTDLRQPRAGRGYSAEDAILGDLTGGRVLRTQLDRERQITLIRLAKAVEQDFAHKTRSGETRFTHARAETLAGRMEGKATLKVNETESVIVPKEIASRWTRQISEPSRVERTGRYATRQFVRTVLPFSVTWQAGNVADLFTRLVVADARFAVPGLAGKSGVDLVDAVETAMRDLDPHLAGELTQALKGHFGARSTIEPLKFSGITHDSKHALVRAAGEKVSAVRDLPGVHRAAERGRKITDGAFAANTKVESALVKRASGVAMEKYAKALGYDVADHKALALKLAGEFKDNPAKLMEFQRRTLEITGDYVTRGPGLKAAQHLGVPFIQWIKAANKFVFHTLPVGHPYKTAMMLWAGSITEAQRRELGLSGYITPDEARQLAYQPVRDGAHPDDVRGQGPKVPQEGYLAGGFEIPGVGTVPVSPLTSLGEAAGLMGDIGKFVAGGGQDKIRAVGQRVLPMVIKPGLRAENYGAVAGASSTADAFIPGAKQVRRALEGERGHPRSTIVKPIGTGDKSVKARALAAVSAPIAEPFPDKGHAPKPGTKDARRGKPGDTIIVKSRGPGGVERRIPVRRVR